MPSSDLSRYFDYAAATPTDPEFLEYYLEVSPRTWANPAALHTAGRASRAVLESARRSAATTLGAHPSEIIFVNSATEANNLAWQGLPGDILSTTHEHASLESDMDRPVVRLTPDQRGEISIDTILDSLTPTTRLLSLIWIQNELGTVRDIQNISTALQVHNHERHTQGIPRVYFHTDAVQAPNYFAVDVDTLGVDLLTLSAQKIYAPRGSALLYIRQGTPLRPIIHGGNQESGLWSGTPNVAAHATFARALELTQSNRESQTTHARTHQATFHDWATTKLQIHCNTSSDSSPGHVHLSFARTNQEELLTYLDLQGFAVSAGSSCASGSLESSPVVATLGLPSHYSAHLRLTLGRYTTAGSVEALIDTLEQFLTL